MSKNDNPSLNTITILILIIGVSGIFIMLSVLFSVTQESRTHNSPDTTLSAQEERTLSPTIPPIPGGILSESYTISLVYPDIGAAIRFDHPPLGDFCNGCVSDFPGGSITPNMRGGMFRGTHDQPSTAEPIDWTVIVGMLETSEEDYIESESPLEPEYAFATDLEQLTQKEVGETYVLTTDLLPAYTVVRNPDVFHDQLQTTTYQYTILSAFEDEEASWFPDFIQTEIAIIPYQDDWIFLIYGYAQQEYDLFDDVLQSIEIVQETDQ